MKQKPTSHRRAVGLLLAAAALPLSPAIAQETSTPAAPPVVDLTPPPAPTVPPPSIQAPPAPTVAAPPPVAAPVAPPAPEATSEPAAPARTTATRRAPAPAARSPVRAPARASGPAAAPAAAATAAPAPAPAPATAPLAATPPGSEAPAAAPAPAPTETAAAPATTGQPARGSIWPWLIGAILVIGAAALLLRRRRRRDEAVYYEESIDEPEVVAVPAMTRPLEEETIAPAAVAPEVAAPAAAAAAAAPAETGRPAIALEMRPKRAGVNEDDAVVEFELTVDNRGTAAARDLRISTWMFPAGQASEAERALILDNQADLPAVTIESGGAKRIESAVALPTAEIAQDAVLPVVVAEAHYRLPDGTEEKTSASFEVGVPIGDELAHFDLENPSGLHDDVVARPHRENVDA